MRNRLITGRRVVMASLVLLSGCMSSRSSLPSGETVAEQALSGRIDLERFDFAEAGYWAMTPEQRLIWRSPLDRMIFGRPVTSQTCDAVERRRFAAAMWLQLLIQAPDAAAWSTDWSALREALARHDADVRAAGNAAARGRNVRVTELARRVARDQIIRDPERDARWTASVPMTLRGSWYALKLVRMVSIDCDNTEWLRGQLRDVAWFDIPSFGPTADKDAWLLVQHADRTPEFQREVLAHLRSLAPGQTDSRNLAYLEDRVAIAEKRPQRFGTQGKCGTDGTWSPQTIEDPAGVDACRATLGLAPMAEHAKQFDGLCPKLQP